MASLPEYPDYVQYRSYCKAVQNLANVQPKTYPNYIQYKRYRKALETLPEIGSNGWRMYENVPFYCRNVSGLVTGIVYKIVT